MGAIYEAIGGSYSATRMEEPRLAALIHGALGGARTVVNVGAGTGSYEPRDRQVLAVEPSETMIAQRPRSAAPVVRAVAERLPLADGSVDAAMAVSTLHHWADLGAGLRELRRVARQRIVIFSRVPAAGTPFWLTQDYLPALDPAPRLTRLVAAIAQEFPAVSAIPLRLPRTCQDGLFAAYWGRPEMYLDAGIRRNISNFALESDDDLRDGLAALQADLQSGAWDRKYGDLRSLPDLDLGHRVFVATR